MRVYAICIDFLQKKLLDINLYRYAGDNFLEFDEWLKMWTEWGVYDAKKTESIERCRNEFNLILSKHEHSECKTRGLLSLSSMMFI